MKKKPITKMLPEYDFNGGVRGKYSKKFKKGTNIIVLAPDVLLNFPDSDSVNETLRTIVKLASGRKKVLS